MDITINNKKLKIKANVVPKVDVLGPEIQYVPKKLEINKPLPDLKLVTPKVDNEGLQIVHLPKEVKVNKGLLKFDNLRTRIDNKGIDILRGGQSSPTKTFKELVESIQHELSDTQDEPVHDDVEDDHPPESDTDNVFLPEPSSILTNVVSPLKLSISSRTATPSSSSSDDMSLPPTPASRNSMQRLFSLGSRRPSHQISPGSPARSATLEDRANTPRPPTVIKVSPVKAPSPRPPPSPPQATPSPKPRLPTPPASPELILKINTSPPSRIPSPTPPPSKLIQVSPVRNQEMLVQTDTIDTLDMFNQTEFEEEPKKGSKWKWWHYTLILIVLIIVFVGAGLGTGYAIKWFNRSKLSCDSGFVKVGDLCHETTTSSPLSTTAPCDGCNCPVDISLDPDNSTGDSVVLTSPRYPSKYKHNSDCTWNIFSTRGQLQLTFTQFNLEWAQNCRQKDFVFLDQVQSYGRMWLCGPFLPPSFLTQTSKFSRLSVRFKSNDAVTRLGFRAVVTATGVSSDIKELISFDDTAEDAEDTTLGYDTNNSSLFQRRSRIL